MNIKQVAQLAGVSTATVSRTINGSDKVTPETAEQVRKAIQTLRYFPNTNAQALGSGRSSLYGLIISDITNPFFPELVKSFEDLAIKNGLDILVSNTDYDPQRTEHCIARLLQRKVDGVAIMTTEMESGLIEEFSRRQIPLVFLDTARPQRNVGTVNVDYATGIDAAIEHLHTLGHRRIAFIRGSSQHKSPQLRLEAFKKSMRARKLALAASDVVAGDHTMEGGFAAMQQLLAHKQAPQAVICSNDLTAMGALGAIHRAGLRVPKDISLVGFDDITMSAYTEPPLTTVHLSRSEIARAAFTALYHHGERGHKREQVIQPSLVIRGTTAQPAERSRK